MPIFEESAIEENSQDSDCKVNEDTFKQAMASGSGPNTLKMLQNLIPTTSPNQNSFLNDISVSQSIDIERKNSLFNQ
jgi:hypothetical protein